MSEISEELNESKNDIEVKDISYDEQSYSDIVEEVEQYLDKIQEESKLEHD